MLCLTEISELREITDRDRNRGRSGMGRKERNTIAVLNVK
jgi:hypothetical protein